MTDAQSLALSDRFLAWLARAGWAASRWNDDGSFDEQGDCSIWEEDQGGRVLTAYLLHRRESDGWVEVAKGSAERLVFAASGLAAVERYFWGLLADAVRERLGLRELQARTDIASGYRIEDGLRDAAGRLVAKGEQQSLVALSRSLAPTLDQLETSLLDPEGKPLFAVRDATARAETAAILPAPGQPRGA
ncbi:hypothetical protein Srot_0590 [Segniliparus rotundus DSM 44985]|uniref:Uncharacterized protein n=1 Tax=Segniliparus rotundus (strain ATCC BAA-972 / CDC 1076 / CIP 108378 / DSM 44985 / JCM 13578) TaxID=640132 RepID=D6ZCN0_SEGRD|nr:Imm61 family immunity protein [Segniliparus rotundus]ADG97072.1 hypothetical protein Srot_0590 [Segniliparus rotundus DSM 44985]